MGMSSIAGLLLFTRMLADLAPNVTRPGSRDKKPAAFAQVERAYNPPSIDNGAN
jgi:hypothetical protein